MKFTNLELELKLLGEEVVETYKENLLKGLPNRDGYTYRGKIGKLYNSVDFKIDINQENGNSKIYFISEDYWINIENGRKVGAKMPSTLVIEKWIKNKNIIDRNSIGIKRQAFLIARSISKNGIKAKPFLENTLKTIENNLNERISNALTLDYKEHLKLDLKNVIDKFTNIKIII